jgi:polysaccharide deacetylase family protein (PEP-CTERM system associated)
MNNLHDVVEQRVVNAITVDVEDYFQVQAYADVISRDQWDRFPRRVEANTDRILEHLAFQDICGTFFTLGWVAERHPALIRRIVDAGHELASHGYGHQRVDRMSISDFRADIGRARRLLEDVGGVAVTGYRAPTFSIGPRNPEAWDALEEEGHLYSSSVFPVRHDLYGAPDAPRVPYRPTAGTLWEIPMTTVRLMNRNLPCAGGGYFRLLPYQLYASGIARLHRKEQSPAIFYTHPWELDPGQPRIMNARLLAQFRHRVNLGQMEMRMRKLLKDFAWDRMDRVFGHLFQSIA